MCAGFANSVGPTHKAHGSRSNRFAKVALSLRDRWRVEEMRFECELAWAGFGRLWCDLASCRGATGLPCSRVGCSDRPPLAIRVAQFDQRAVWSRQQTQCEGNNFGGERFADWLGRTSNWLQFVIR